MLFQFTSVGVLYFTNNFTGLTLTSARFGSGSNYTPSQNPEGLSGSVVYTTTPSASVIVDPNTVRYSVVLDTTVGPFNFGEVGFYIGNQLIAVGVMNSLMRKDLAIGGNNGNTIRLDLFVTRAGSNFYGVLNTASSDQANRIPVVSTPDGLAPPSNVESNIFQVRGVSGSEVPYVAIADSQTGLWYFSNRPRLTLSSAVTSTSANAVAIASPHGLTFSDAYQYVLEFTSGALRGYCRQLTQIGPQYFQWQAALLTLPSAGDTFVIHGPALGSVSNVGAENLNDLSDVNVLGPIDGQVLKFDAAQGKFINSSLNSSIRLADLTDVQITGTTPNNSALLWDAAASKWKAGAVTGLFSHNSLTNLQGGAPGDYSHLTSAQVGGLNSLLANSSNYVLSNNANIFSKGQTVTPGALNTGNGYVASGQLSNIFTLTLNADVLLPNPILMSNGQTINLIIRQDSVGGHALTFGPAWTFTGNATPSVAQAPYAVSVLSGIFDQSTSSLVCAIASGSLTGYTLTPADANNLGGVKVGSGLSITVDGTMSVSSAYNLPTAAAGVLGGVKIGNSMSIASGVLDGKIASSVQLGMVKAGSGVTIASDGTLTSGGAIATPTLAGVVKPSTGLSVSADGTLEVVGSQPLTNYATSSKNAVVSVSSTVTGHTAGLAIDEDDTTYAALTSVPDSWVAITLDTARPIFQWRVLQGTGANGATSISLQYNNGSWQTVDTFTGAAADTGLRNLSSSIPASGQWRVLANSGGGGQWNVYSVQLNSTSTSGVASSMTAGLVKIGSNINVTNDGTISVTPYTLPVADANTIGGVKIGTNLTIGSNGVLSSNFTTKASSSTLGLVRVGTNLSIDGSGVLSAASTPVATSSVSGTIKLGNTLAANAGVVDVSISHANLTDTVITALTNNDVLHYDTVTGKWINGAIPVSYTLPTASSSVLGGVKIGSGLAINSGTGVLSASPYTLPVAGFSSLGGVKIGDRLSIDGSGVLSADVQNYILPVATSSVLGGVKAGSNVTIDSTGVLSATAYTLPNASSTVLGGVKVGTGLAIDGTGVLSTTNSYVLPTASSTVLGGVKVGTNLSIDGTGVLSAATYTLPIATSSALGGVKAGTTLTIDGAGVLNYALPTASSTVLGGIKVGSGLAIASGVLSATGQVLSGLGDVALTTVSDGQVLTYNGTSLKWTNANPAAGYTLPVATTTVLGGVKQGTNIAIDGTGVISAALALGGLTNVNLTSPSNGDALVYNSGTSKWINTPAGSAYTLPAATVSTLGGVIVGTGLAVAGDGTLSATATAYTLPTATSSVLGGVKVGTGLTISSGVLAATPYSLPTASASVLGGVKVGTNLAIDGSGILSGTYSYTLPVSTSTVLGGVKAGSNVTIDGTGVLSVSAPYTLPISSASVLGGVKVGSGLAIDGTGILSTTGSGYTLPIATSSVLGGIKVGSGLAIDGTGVLSSTGGGYTLPVATTTVLGGVKQGTNVTIAGDGTLSVAAPYTLPTASSSVLGGIKVGTGLSIDGSGVLSSAGGGYTLPVATSSVLGGVKQGNYVTIDGTGILSASLLIDNLTDVTITSPANGDTLSYNTSTSTWVNAPATGGSYTLPIASSTVLGGIKVGANLSIDGSGVLSATAGGYTLPAATTTTLGGVIVGAGLAVSGTGLTNTSVLLNSQTGTTYAIVAGDNTKFLLFNNASAVAVSLPVASTTGFGAGWFCYAENLGAGNVTITPATSTIDGATTVLLRTGQGVMIVSTGTNYYTIRGTGAGKVTLTQPATNSVLTISDGKTLTATNTLTFSGVDGKTVNFNNTLTFAGTDATTLTFPPASAEIGYQGLPQNSQSAAYTLVLTDKGKHIYHPSADVTARIWTIPANSAVAFPIGTTLTFINDTGAGVITIAITTDTLKLAGSTATGSRTLAAGGMATAVKMTSTTWIINGAGLS